MCVCGARARGCVCVACVCARFVRGVRGVCGRARVRACVCCACVCMNFIKAHFLSLSLFRARVRVVRVSLSVCLRVCRDADELHQGPLSRRRPPGARARACVRACACACVCRERGREGGRAGGRASTREAIENLRLIFFKPLEKEFGFKPRILCGSMCVCHSSRPYVVLAGICRYA